MSDTLTPAERDEYDSWLQRIPTGGEGEALWNLLRLQIRHDTAPLHVAVRGWPELLDAADERSRELVDAARELRAATDAALAQVSAATTVMREMRAELDRHYEENRADRAALHLAVEAVDARVTRVERRLSGRVLALAVVVAALVAEALLRYWPIIVGGLLSLALMTWRGL